MELAVFRELAARHPYFDHTDTTANMKIASKQEPNSDAFPEFALRMPVSKTMGC